MQSPFSRTKFDGMQEKMQPVYDSYAAGFDELGKEMYDIKCSVEEAWGK